MPPFFWLPAKLLLGRSSPALRRLLLALAFGLWLWLGYGVGLGAGSGWMHAKLLIVLLLLVYHHLCGRRLKAFEQGANSTNSQ